MMGQKPNRRLGRFWLRAQHPVVRGQARSANDGFWRLADAAPVQAGKDALDVVSRC
jgi:hypothetical protein